MSFLVVLILLLMCTAADSVGADLLEPAPVDDRYVGNACVECHRKEGGRLAEMVDREWAKGVHYDNNVACEQCHGGNATVRRDDYPSDDEFKEASHAAFNTEFLFLRNRVDVGVDAAPKVDTTFACRECHKWTIEKRLGTPHGGVDTLPCLFKRYAGGSMSRERGITYICAPCHPETTEKQLSSPHGRRGAPSCLFCHGEGGHTMQPATIDIIDPRPREDLGRCSLCHKSETMKAVRHIRETLEETAERIKVIAEQHEELQRLRYRSLALGEMYDHVDDVWASLRQVQHGCNVREINEHAKSIENIAKRMAYDHELVLALHAARQRQTKIALGVAGLLLVLVGMLVVYRRAFGARTEAWTIRNPNRRTLTPPCNHDCPAGNDVQGFIAAIMKEDYDQALDILLTTTPLPGVCGRVCPAPCMDLCNRRYYDESINIRELERYVADHGCWDRVTRPWRAERIAVVGSGPAGLSATYQLARLGYRITLIERDNELGGVLRTGIPTYRLPRDVLDREIGRILEHGVTVRTGQPIRRHDLPRLSQEHAAVLVATGLQELRSLDLGDTARDFVRQGIRFLDDARKGKASLQGKNVVVIGGGDVAIDVARTALRLCGAAVRLYCLEGRDEMPAHTDEIEEAVAEGIEINSGWGPVAIVSEQGRPRGMKFHRCMTVFDEHGVFSPSFDEEDEMSVDADIVFLALARLADTSILPDEARVHERNVLSDSTGTAIFVAGDLAGGEGMVAAAIGNGRHAAWRIHRALTGEDLFPSAHAPIATPDHIIMYLFAHAQRRSGRTLAPAVRRTSFAEVHLGLPESTEQGPALAEAERCFSCGVCNQCDRCVIHCPEGAVLRDGDDYLVEYDYCAGCGTCSIECPRGVIYMVDERAGGATAERTILGTADAS